MPTETPVATPGRCLPKVSVAVWREPPAPAADAVTVPSSNTASRAPTAPTILITRAFISCLPLPLYFMSFLERFQDLLPTGKRFDPGRQPVFDRPLVGERDLVHLGLAGGADPRQTAGNDPALVDRPDVLEGERALLPLVGGLDQQIGDPAAGLAGRPDPGGGE